MLIGNRMKYITRIDYGRNGGGNLGQYIDVLTSPVKWLAWLTM